MQKRKVRCEKVCQLMLPVLRPSSGNATRQPSTPPTTIHTPRMSSTRPQVSLPPGAGHGPAAVGGALREPLRLLAQLHQQGGRRLPGLRRLRKRLPPCDAAAAVASTSCRSPARGGACARPGRPSVRRHWLPSRARRFWPMSATPSGFSPSPRSCRRHGRYGQNRVCRCRRDLTVPGGERAAELITRSSARSNARVR